MSVSYSLLRALLFRLEPERAHALALFLLRVATKIPLALRLLRAATSVEGARPVQAFGLTFPNAVGLAAGYDKDGRALRGLASLGFGHLEVGTVTPEPQPGNPRPRVFRLVEECALINRMGFPSGGAESLARRLRAEPPRGFVLGINLGKQKDTPIEEAARDYESLVSKLAPLADYLTLNVSSPNTLGLRRLQARDLLEDLLGRVHARRRIEEDRLKKRVPLILKLAPDLEEAELDGALEVIVRTGMDGVLATNTTLSRPGGSSPRAAEAGGLSGAPLRARSTEMVRAIVKRTSASLPVIAAGGIANAADAMEKIDAGATLVQIYTGLVYEGPGLVARILRGLVARSSA